MADGVDVALQTVAAGLTNGAVYGLAALGVVLVLRASRIVSLAQGEAITMGALGTWWLDLRWGWPRGIAAVVAVVAAAAVFALSSRVVLLRGGGGASVDTLGVSLATLALALFLQGLLFAAFGRELHGSAPMLGSSPFRVAGVTVPSQTVVMLATAAVVGAGSAAVLRWTMAGRAVVACSENRLGAAVAGVDVRRVTTVTFGVAGALGALAGVLLAPVTIFSYVTGFGLALRGLAAAALVGFRSAGAGLVAGLAVGVLEAVVSTHVSSGYQEPFVAAVLIGALVAWPSLSPAADDR